MGLTGPDFIAVFVLLWPSDHSGSGLWRLTINGRLNFATNLRHKTFGRSQPFSIVLPKTLNIDVALNVVKHDRALDKDEPDIWTLLRIL
jgi:hypothetical protein